MIKQEFNNISQLTPNVTSTYLEIYLFYQKIGKNDRKGNFEEFFDKLTLLDNQLMDSIVFLEADSAWQYSRFMDTGHVVLKAYIPELAIEGRSHGLTLKKGFLTKENIHGCFPGWAKGLIYVKNPFFNQYLLQANLVKNELI